MEPTDAFAGCSPHNETVICAHNTVSAPTTVWHLVHHSSSRQTSVSLLSRLTFEQLAHYLHQINVMHRCERHCCTCFHLTWLLSSMHISLTSPMLSPYSRVSNSVRLFKHFVFDDIFNINVVFHVNIKFRRVVAEEFSTPPKVLLRHPMKCPTKPPANPTPNLVSKLIPKGKNMFFVNHLSPSFTQCALTTDPLSHKLNADLRATNSHPGVDLSCAHPPLWESLRNSHVVGTRDHWRAASTPCLLHLINDRIVVTHLSQIKTRFANRKKVCNVSDTKKSGARAWCSLQLAFPLWCRRKNFPPSDRTQERRSVSAEVQTMRQSETWADELHNSISEWDSGRDTDPWGCLRAATTNGTTIESTLKTMMMQTAFRVPWLASKSPSALAFCPCCLASVAARLNSGWSLIGWDSPSAWRIVNIQSWNSSYNASASHPCPALSFIMTSIPSKFWHVFLPTSYFGIEHLYPICLHNWHNAFVSPESSTMGLSLDCWVDPTLWFFRTCCTVRSCVSAWMTFELFSEYNSGIRFLPSKFLATREQSCSTLLFLTQKSHLTKTSLFFALIQNLRQNCLRLVKFTCALRWWWCFFFYPRSDEPVWSVRYSDKSDKELVQKCVEAKHVSMWCFIEIKRNYCRVQVDHEQPIMMKSLMSVWLALRIGLSVQQRDKWEVHCFSFLSKTTCLSIIGSPRKYRYWAYPFLNLCMRTCATILVAAKVSLGCSDGVRFLLILTANDSTLFSSMLRVFLFG